VRPILLDVTTAAVYADVAPATLRVWRLRYGLTKHLADDGSTLYDLAELADVLARRRP
jgi:hypothetical protein